MGCRKEKNPSWSTMERIKPGPTSEKKSPLRACLRGGKAEIKEKDHVSYSDAGKQGEDSVLDLA